jgi:transcriptional regulator with XRE-family HTH domain
MTRRQLGLRIRLALRASGVPQADACRAIGVTTAAMQYWLNGRHVPDALMLAAIARICECTPNDLLGYPIHGAEALRMRLHRAVDAASLE